MKYFDVTKFHKIICADLPWEVPGVTNDYNVTWGRTDIFKFLNYVLGTVVNLNTASLILFCSYVQYGIIVDYFEILNNKSVQNSFRNRLNYTPYVWFKPQHYMNTSNADRSIPINNAEIIFHISNTNITSLRNSACLMPLNNVICCPTPRYYISSIFILFFN